VLTTGVTQSSLIKFPPKNLPTKCLNSRMKNNGFWWWWDDGGWAMFENGGVSEGSKTYLDLFSMVENWSWLGQNGRKLILTWSEWSKTDLDLVRMVENWSWLGQNGRKLILTWSEWSKTDLDMVKTVETESMTLPSSQFDLHPHKNFTSLVWM
jgi:hypothetical protein